MRIWDTFTFGGELDLLECRLRELDGTVYRHVICESPVTFQGTPKPLTLLENLDRFRPWLDRITYVTVDPDELPQGTDPPWMSPGPVYRAKAKSWQREKLQRDTLRQGLPGIEPGDLVLHGDVDEIPRPDALGMVRKPVVLSLRSHVYAVDWRHPEPTLGTIALSWRRMKKIGSFGDLRQKHRGRLRKIPEAGWHLSWLGGPDAVRAKCAAFSHSELAWRIADSAVRSYAEGWCPWDDVTQEPAEVDTTWPEWIAKRECPSAWFRPREDSDDERIRAG